LLNLLHYLMHSLVHVFNTICSILVSNKTWWITSKFRCSRTSKSHGFENKKANRHGWRTWQKKNTKCKIGGLFMDCDFLWEFFEEMLKLLAKGRGFWVKSNPFPIKGVSSRWDQLDNEKKSTLVINMVRSFFFPSVDVITSLNLIFASFFSHFCYHYYKYCATNTSSWKKFLLFSLPYEKTTLLCLEYEIFIVLKKKLGADNQRLQQEVSLCTKWFHRFWVNLLS